MGNEVRTAQGEKRFHHVGTSQGDRWFQPLEGAERLESPQHTGIALTKFRHGYILTYIVVK